MRDVNDKEEQSKSDEIQKDENQYIQVDSILAKTDQNEKRAIDQPNKDGDEGDQYEGARRFVHLIYNVIDEVVKVAPSDQVYVLRMA